LFRAKNSSVASPALRGLSVIRKASPVSPPSVSGVVSALDVNASSARGAVAGAGPGAGWAPSGASARTGPLAGAAVSGCVVATCAGCCRGGKNLLTR
jgi:hypothetical protein